MDQRRDITILARDGFELGASMHGPESDVVTVIAGATGVPHRFYRRFAGALAEAGHRAVTFDFRGVGDSRPEPLRGFDATASDWIFQDLDGVLDFVRRRLDPERVAIVGHSFGGQVAGMLDNAGVVDAMLTVSSQSGYWRIQGGGQKYAVWAHFHLVIPITTALLGYAPMSRLGVGEDLPEGVAREWARWGRHPRYLLGMGYLPSERYAAFRAPVLAYSIDDDDWGTARSVDAMMGAYPVLERRHLVPADLGVESLGHMGWFKAHASALWEPAIEWLDRNVDRST